VSARARVSAGGRVGARGLRGLGAVGVLACAAGCGGAEREAMAPAPTADDGAPVAETRRPAAERPVARPPTAAPATGPFGARLLRPVRLRARPGGRVVARLGTRTPFRSPRILAVVARRDGWLGVLSEHMPNGRAGWIRARDARLLSEPYALEADRSARRVVVRRGGRVVRRLRVAIGAPGTTTPTGRFAVTDTLRFTDAGAYGCCAVALSGRQPNVPQDWPGGDRLAIHGTADESSIGRAVSKGCLRARRADMLWLVRRLPAGTPVTIRA